MLYLLAIIKKLLKVIGLYTHSLQILYSANYYIHKYTNKESFFSEQVESSPSEDSPSPQASDDSDYDPPTPDSPPRGRGRRRGQVRHQPARGRGRGRARGGVRVVTPAAARAYQSYDDPDTANQLPQFAPRRQPGLHLIGPVLRGAMTRAVDFFHLFITVDLLQEISMHTNPYGWATIAEKSYYGDKEGAWKETNPEEIEKFIALILYCGLIRENGKVQTPLRNLAYKMGNKVVGSC